MNGRKKAPTKFEDKKIDASIDTCCWITCLPFTFGAIPFKTIIYLDSEEVTKTDHYICGQSGESGQRRMGSDSQDDQRIGSGCGSDFSHTRASPASFPLPPPTKPPVSKRPYGELGSVEQSNCRKCTWNRIIQLAKIFDTPIFP